jgi:hypothetical protein
MHAAMQRFQKTLAYFAAALSYSHKMFIEWTPEVHGDVAEIEDGSEAIL